MTCHWRNCSVSLILSAVVLTAAVGFFSAAAPAADTPASDTAAASAESSASTEQAVPQTVQDAVAASSPEAQIDPTAPIEMFAARDRGLVELKFIAQSDRKARLLITNKTKQPLSIKLPEAFAGIPALAQIGGQFGGGGGQFGGVGNTTIGGGQGVGGGFGGGGGGFGGGGFGGGGLGGFGGAFSVAPEDVGRIDMPVVCLEHGKPNPTPGKNYVIVPVTEFVHRPAVVELLKAFGRGELDHGATQAAVWHLNNDMGWQELASKLDGTERSRNRAPYFNGDQIRAGMGYANQALYHSALADQQKKPGEANPRYEDPYLGSTVASEAGNQGRDEN